MSPTSLEHPSSMHEIATTSIKEQLQTLQFSAPSKHELSHLLAKTANDPIEASHTHQEEPELSLEGLCQDARNSIEEYLPLEDLAKLMRTSKDNNVLFGNTERGQKLKEANQLAREPFTVPPLSKETLLCITSSSLLAGFGAGMMGGWVAAMGVKCFAQSTTVGMAIFSSLLGGGGCLTILHCSDAHSSRKDARPTWYQNAVKDYEAITNYRNNLDNNLHHVRIRALRAELMQHK